MESDRRFKTGRSGSSEAVDGVGGVVEVFAEVESSVLASESVRRRIVGREESEGGVDAAGDFEAEHPSYRNLSGGALLDAMNHLLKPSPTRYPSCFPTVGGCHRWLPPAAAGRSFCSTHKPEPVQPA